MASQSHARDERNEDMTHRFSKKIKVDHPSRSAFSYFTELPSSNTAHGAQTHGVSSAASLAESKASTTSRPTKSNDHSRRIEIVDPNLALRHKLTSEEGQLEANPNYTPDQARQAAKREYNRRNAARARIRLKCVLSEMQEKCATMSDEMQALRDENKALKAEWNEMKYRSCTDDPRSNVTCSEHERAPYFQPFHVSGGFDGLIGRLFSQQLPMNDPRLQQWGGIGGSPSLVPNVQPESVLARQLLNSLILARARATLDPNSDLSVMNLESNQSRFFPK